MSKIARLLIPLTSIAALAVVMMIVVPGGARGSSRSPFSFVSADHYAFGEDTVVTKTVNGNVQVYGGSATIVGLVTGNLLVIGGNATFRGAGRVKGDVIIAGGKVIDGENRVEGRVYPLASPEGAVASLANNAIVASLLLVWLIAAVIVTLMNGREVRLSSAEVRSSALHCFVLGLVALTSFVLTAIAFSYLVPFVIGIPLLAALAIFAAVTKIYGMISIFHAIGTLVAGSRSREQLARRKWLRGDLAMVVIGVLLLGAVRLIPVVGTIVWGLASIFGVGVALATKFGRREPWFLAWRPAEA